MDNLIWYVIGFIVIVQVLRALSARPEITGQLPCNEVRQPHKWRWVAAKPIGEKLQCRECGTVFGED